MAWEPHCTGTRYCTGTKYCNQVLYYQLLWSYFRVGESMISTKTIEFYYPGRQPLAADQQPTRDIMADLYYAGGRRRQLWKCPSHHGQYQTDNIRGGGNWRPDSVRTVRGFLQVEMGSSMWLENSRSRRKRRQRSPGAETAELAASPSCLWHSPLVSSHLDSGASQLDYWMNTKTGAGALGV